MVLNTTSNATSHASPKPNSSFGLSDFRISEIVSRLLLGAAIIAPISLALANTAQAQYRTPPPPPDAPEAGRGGGDRSFCPALAADVDITALIPSPEDWGTTITPTPTVWLNAAYEKGEIEELPPAALYVLDRTTGDVIDLQELVVLPNTPGTFSLSLPVLPTENKWYEWYLELDCTPANDPDNFSYLEIGGLIYFDSTVASSEAVQAKTPAEQIVFYEENGVWYDLLDHQVQTQCADGDSVEVSAPISILLENGGLGVVQSTEIICP